MKWFSRALRAPSLVSALALCAAGSAGHGDTLRDIYELALLNDASLKTAQANLRADQEIERQARSHLLPQLNADAHYGALRRDIDGRGLQLLDDTPNDLRLGPQNQHTDISTRERTWSVNLSQALIDLPAWYDFKNGKALGEQARAQFAAAQQDLIVRTADAYFNVLRQMDNLRVSKAEEIANRQQLEQAQQSFEVGSVANTDVEEARAAYDASVALRIADQGSLATAYEALTVLTGREHANLWPLSGQFQVTDPLPADRQQWVEFARHNNYALEASLHAVEAARQNAIARRMEHAPRLSASLGYENGRIDGSQSVHPDSFFAVPPDSDTVTRAAMLKLTIPLYSGGYTSSAQRQAQARYDAALQRRIDTERTVVQETRSRYIAAGTDVQRVKARAQSIRSAQSALDATRAGYEAGTRNIVDVLQAQRTFFAAQRDYANARYDYVMDILHLKEQAGMLGPQDILSLNDQLVAPAQPEASTDAP